jgi:hypothetical protein
MGCDREEGQMSDALSTQYADLLTGCYDCVDRIVLNAYNVLCYNPGGFRTWWRRLQGSDDTLDEAHLMRMAGRFSRRVHGFAKAHQIPVVACLRGERKHQLAEEYLTDHPAVRGLFMILVSRAVAPVWEVTRSESGVLRNLQAKKAFVNHYSFHILDPDWGHLTIKMSGHPPFGAQIILNGHEYVRLQAARAGVAYDLAGNAFTRVPEPDALAAVADTLSEERMIGRLVTVCERWIYRTCLCFALHSEDQERTGFRYDYSVYQLEYSRNLLFHSGHQMEQVFQGLIDRTRSRLGVPELRTIFGQKHRPHQDRKDKATQIAVQVETPVYDLTLFKLHFGKLTLKAYTKGEHVLRFEAIVHNAAALGCGRVLPRFPHLVAHLHALVDRFLETIWCLDHAFVADATLEALPTPAHVGKTRVGGIDLNKPRMRAVLAATLALALAPEGFRVGDFARQVQQTGHLPADCYGVRQAAYDLKKLRAKEFVVPVVRSRRYRVSPDGVRTLAALVVLRDQVIRPLLAGTAKPKVGRKPKGYTPIDAHYETLRKEMGALFTDLGIAAA